MKQECRILIEGNTSSGFTYTPVWLIEHEGDSCLPAFKDVDSLPTSFASKSDIRSFANMLIEACEKDLIHKSHRIRECSNPTRDDD